MSARDSLGRGFARLWAAAIFTNAGDGMARVAIPLVSVLFTRDPLAIAALYALGVVPWLFFGVYSGVIVDRADRRRVMALANVLRLAAAVAVAAALLADTAQWWMLAAASFVFGVGEVFADNATNAMMPSLVRRDQLDRANGRIQAAQVGVDMFVAAPIAGLLFAIAPVVPMVASSGAFAAVVVLAAGLPAVAARAARQRDAAAEAAALVSGAPVERATVRARDGLRFLWEHRYLRSMVLLTTAFAALLTFAQAATILVFLDVYGVPPAAMGLLTAAIGAGGLAGALAAPALVKRWGRGRVMLAGCLTSAVGIGAVAIAPSVVVAVAVYAVGSFGVGVWNVPWAATRQSVVPGELLGRVLGIARTVGWALIPAATLLGGVVARTSLTVPFAVGGVAMVVVSLVGARLVLSTDRQLPAPDPGAADEMSPGAPAPVPTP